MIPSLRGARRRNNFKKKSANKLNILNEILLRLESGLETKNKINKLSSYKNQKFLCFYLTDYMILKKYIKNNCIFLVLCIA
jgi:hypothetical protein